MTDAPEPEQILSLLISAAGNADAVRLASVAYNLAQAGAETFNRTVLTQAWAARWRHHLQMPGGRTPEQRVNRSVPILTACTALETVGGPDLRVGDPDILQFLADRVYMAEALDKQAPMSNTLPVGEATRAAAAALVSAAQDSPLTGEGILTAAATVDSVDKQSGTFGEMTLAVSAEVIKGGTPPEQQVSPV